MLKCIEAEKCHVDVGIEAIIVIENYNNIGIEMLFQKIYIYIVIETLFQVIYTQKLHLFFNDFFNASGVLLQHLYHFQSV